jgi:hypothetical protein
MPARAVRRNERGLLDMATGNMSLVCLVDTSNAEEYERMYEAAFSALDFWGMPYSVLDVSKASVTVEQLAEHCAVLIAQQSLGASLTHAGMSAILGAVEQGTGLVCFDGDVHRYRQPLKDVLGMKTAERYSHMAQDDTELLRVWDNTHYITRNKGLEMIPVNKRVPYGDIRMLGKHCRVLVRVANQSGQPGLIVARHGNGRMVVSAVSNKLWLNEYFGHGGGIDDLFWRSIVWAARKPFAMLAMPPFVTARLDDCSGANNFEWLRTFNKHGWVPHASLFLDNISDEGRKAIKEFYDNGSAEFSAHAFDYTNIIYWKPAAPLWHETGRCYTGEEIEANFTRLDDFAAKAGITWSRVGCDHFGDMAENAIEQLRRRGITYMDGPWFPARGVAHVMERGFKPYDGQGGVIDYHPLYKDFFIVEPCYGRIPWALEKRLLDKGVVTPKPAGQQYDFLWEMRFKADVEEAAWYGAYGLKLLFDNLMFGLLITHEQNIVLYNNSEWDRILSLIDGYLSGYGMIHASWTHIAEYAESRHNTRIARADYDPAERQAVVGLEGTSAVDLKLFVFTEENGEIHRRYEPAGAFNGRTVVRFGAELEAAVPA